MKKWSNGAKKRLVGIRAAEDGEQDMRAIAASIGIIAILAKYGVVIK